MKKESYRTYAAVFMLDTIIRKDGYKSKNKFGNECTSFVCEQEMVNLDDSPTVGPHIVDMVERLIPSILNGTSCNEFISSCRSAISTYNSEKDRWSLSETIKSYQLGFLIDKKKTKINQ